MLVFVKMNFTDVKLVRLNCVQCNQSVVFYSDVLDASGNALDRWYLARCPFEEEEVWSTLLFPQEMPPPIKDFKLCAHSLHFIEPTGQPQHRLGRFVEKGHKIWEWWYDIGSLCLYHLQWATIDVYTPSLVPGHMCCPNRWTHSRVNQHQQDTGSICTVRDVALGVKTIVSYAEGQPYTCYLSTIFCPSFHPPQKLAILDRLCTIYRN